MNSFPFLYRVVLHRDISAVLGNVLLYDQSVRLKVEECLWLGNMATTDEERLLWRCVDRVFINSHSVYLCDYIHIISWEWNCKDMVRLGVIICSRDVDEEEEEKHDGVRNSATSPLTDWVWEWKIDKHGVYLLCITYPEPCPYNHPGRGRTEISQEEDSRSTMNEWRGMIWLSSIWLRQ